MLRRLWLRSVVLITVGMTGCSPRHTPAPEAQIDFLASDAHVVIGDAALVLPFVALPRLVAEGPSFSLDRQGDRERARERLSEFRKVAVRPSTAPTLDKIEVNIGAYGWNDSDMSFRRICPRLKRRWSASVCDNPWAPLAQAMPPNRVYLVDVRKFSAFGGHWTVGGERMVDHLRAMRLKVGEVSTVCDTVASSSGTRFCTAAVLIDRNLGAVWTVWDRGDGGETHREQAEREAKAVVAFVSYAIGPSETFSRVLAAACESRKPGSPPPPKGIEACGG